MLITVLAMALAVSLEPYRIGMTVLLLNRPRPLRQLLAFLAGGFATGMTVGLAVLFLFRHRLPVAAQFTLPNVQMLLGVLALLVATVLVVPGSTGRIGGTGERWAGWRRRLLDGRSLWVAAAAGVGIALPSVDYLAALAVILASGATAGTQVAALLAYHVVAFGLIELPLLCYLVAPQSTRAAISAVNDWVRSRRRTEVAALLAVLGVLLIVLGLIGR